MVHLFDLVSVFKTRCLWLKLTMLSGALSTDIAMAFGFFFFSAVLFIGYHHDVWFFLSGGGIFKERERRRKKEKQEERRPEANRAWG